MKALTLLLHDERFSGWTPEEKAGRQHFSIGYLKLYKEAGFEPLLYSYHQDVSSKQTYELRQSGLVKVFPVKFRFPPFVRFGNDHNIKQVLMEMINDEPELVHFHNYYLFSFPYFSVFVKNKLNKPLIAQLHGYNDGSFRRWMYLPNLLALRKADRILYSYAPEREVFSKLGVTDRAVRLPVPGVDPEIFRPKRRKQANRLLYVGRLPNPESVRGEKSPFVLIQILKRLLQRSPAFYLDIVGDGPGFARCKSLAEKLGISEHVLFHGYVPHDQLPRFYQSSSMTFSPIRVYDVDGWFDGAVQESLACGTPVAAFKASTSTPLWGTYGFLLSNDVEVAAKELFELLGVQDEIDALAAEGSRFVRECCSSSRIASEFKDLLGSVVRR
jgi:glycosyltransferase involved in cell wall biosynthesis